MTPLEDCKKEALLYQKDDTKVARAYLEKMLDYIIMRNNQSSTTFSGVFARDKFCIGVENNSAINARANPKNGLIVFTKGMLKAGANSDAQIAGSMAHELAHVTLRHNGEIPKTTFFAPLTPQEAQEVDRLEKEITNSIEMVSTVTDKLLDICPALIDFEPTSSLLSPSALLTQMNTYALAQNLCGARWKEFQETSNLLYEALRKTEELPNTAKAILLRHFTPEELANKLESDADEAGIEFLARADINLSYRQKLFLLYSRLSGMTKSCQNGNEPRGLENHPAPCWRFSNIGKELQSHSADYAKFTVNKSLFFVTAPTLAEMQASLAFGVPILVPSNTGE